MPRAAERGAVGLLEDEAVVDVARGDAERDPAVPEVHEPGDGLARDPLEVEVDPGVRAAGEAPSQRDERDAALHQHVDASVDPLRVGDDEGVGEVALHGAAKLVVLAVGGRVGQEHEVEIVAGEHLLQPVGQGEEEGLAEGGAVDVGAHHQRHGVRRALAQAAAGLVGHVAQALGRLLHALARLGVHLAAAVERARDGADGDVELARKLADAERPRRRPALLAALAHAFALHPDPGPSHAAT